MHYYQHNIGDYRRDTTHLSLLEHGVYRQLIDMYYLNESPLASDLNQLFRKVCARTKEEQDAVEIILNEFFQLTEEGWTHKRCDEEIDSYSIQNEDNRAREDNERERNRRHREERKKLFADLREHGQVPKYDLPMDRLRELHKQYCNAKDTDLQRTCNAPATQQVHICNEPDTAITNNALTNNQEPLTNTVITHTYYPSQQSREPTPAASVCLELKKIGIIDVNPAHPELLMLLEAGATLDEFVYAARTAKDKGKGFAYVLGIVKGQRTDAAQLKADAEKRSRSPPSSGASKQQLMMEAGRSLFAHRDEEKGHEREIEGTAEFVECDTNQPVAGIVDKQDL